MCHQFQFVYVLIKSFPSPVYVVLELLGFDFYTIKLSKSFILSQNCRDNTMGPKCEVCVTGYYGNPDLGPCKPCACPTRLQNFAETCQADRYAEYVCNCRVGYTGNRCDRQVINPNQSLMIFLYKSFLTALF